MMKGGSNSIEGGLNQARREDPDSKGLLKKWGGGIFETWRVG